ncbi:hypothetical protein JCM11641_007096 [Rhodosporidiobolus odoratus]
MRSLTLIALLAPLSTLASRLLAIHDTSSSSPSFDVYFASLRDQGFELDVANAEDGAKLLDGRSRDYYSGLIVFAGSDKQLPRPLTPQSLSQRLSPSSTSHASPTNLLLVVPPNAAELWRDFAREFEVDFDDRGQVVVDYFSSSSSDGSLLSLPASSLPSDTSYISPSTLSGPPILYRGAAHLAGRNPLLTNLLHAGSGAFSTDAEAGASPPEEVRIAGSKAGLVSAFQARNNARVVFAGSAELFSDELSRDQAGSPTGNPSFLRDLSAWAFQQTGQLQVVESQHENVGTGEIGPAMYKTGSEMKYTLTLRSSPSTPPLTDLQLEFSMLDPHLRLPLALAPLSHQPSSDPSLKIYSATFTLPDRHGVFALSCSYNRPSVGLNHIQDRHTVSVVPPKHDEYDRFIKGAGPYYAGALSVSAAFAVFVAVWVVSS